MKKIIMLTLFLISASTRATDCFDSAGAAYHIDPDLLRAVSFRESSWNPNALNVVSSKNYAVGLMQIHSQNLPHLAKFGITSGKLYKNKCLNIHTGAYYLALAFHRMGNNWQAVGAYNAGFKKTPTQAARRQKYANEVHAIYRKIKANKLLSQKNKGKSIITAKE